MHPWHRSATVLHVTRPRRNDERRKHADMNQAKPAAVRQNHGKPIETNRLPEPVAGPRRAAKLQAAEGYVPGYFTEDMRAHDWPPGFVAAAPTDRLGLRISARAALENRERMAETGQGWAGGTVVMPGTPSQMRPGWMR